MLARLFGGFEGPEILMITAGVGLIAAVLFMF